MTKGFEKWKTDIEKSTIPQMNDYLKNLFIEHIKEMSEDKEYNDMLEIEHKKWSNCWNYIKEKLFEMIKVKSGVQCVGGDDSWLISKLDEYLGLTDDEPKEKVKNEKEKTKIISKPKTKSKSVRKANPKPVSEEFIQMSLFD